MNTRNNEHGVALVLSLWMLVLLSLVGSMILAASTVEVRLAANDRHAQTALYVADAAIQYAKSDPTIYTTIGDGSVTDTVSYPTVGINTHTAENVSVALLAVGPPPEGSGLPATYQAQYFTVQATGVGPNNSQVLLESQVGRIIPK